jgi:hypothetical protein
LAENQKNNFELGVIDTASTKIAQIPSRIQNGFHQKEMFDEKI